MMRRQITEKTNTRLRAAAWCLLPLALPLVMAAQTQDSSATSASHPATTSQASPASASHSDSTMPRGQKLVLKDGTFQLVREYKVDGDRLTYYSLDTHQWEEMPSALIDWDATKKAAADEAKQDAALVNAVDEREKEESAEVLSVDASIEPAPGVFLPSDVGLFVFDGKTIQPVNQAQLKSAINKGKLLEKVLLPIPIVPTRHLISIAGARAKLRLTDGQPEFYMRTADGSEPEMDLIRAKIHNGDRQVENVDELMGETAEVRKPLALMRWQIAPNVYRYTFVKALDPGEYVLVQTVAGDQIGIYLWDFGVDVAR